MWPFNSSWWCVLRSLLTKVTGWHSTVFFQGLLAPTWMVSTPMYADRCVQKSHTCNQQRVCTISDGRTLIDHWKKLNVIEIHICLWRESLAVKKNNNQRLHLMCLHMKKQTKNPQKITKKLICEDASPWAEKHGGFVRTGQALASSNSLTANLAEKACCLLSACTAQWCERPV